MPDKLPIGTRIRFTKTIIEKATGDHPEFLMAEKGEAGVITGHVADGRRNTYAYQVKVNEWPKAPFLASDDEFEPIEE